MRYLEMPGEPAHGHRTINWSSVHLGGVEARRRQWAEMNKWEREQHL
jgi:hypothetical protein